MVGLPLVGGKISCRWLFRPCRLVLYLLFVYMKLGVVVVKLGVILSLIGGLHWKAWLETKPPVSGCFAFSRIVHCSDLSQFQITTRKLRMRIPDWSGNLMIREAKTAVHLSAVDSIAVSLSTNSEYYQTARSKYLF